MTRILIVEEKHGTYYYDASTAEALEAASAFIVAQRLEDGYWYVEDGEAQRAADTIDTGAAWNFLRSRADYEYEYVFTTALSPVPEVRGATSARSPSLSSRLVDSETRDDTYSSVP